MMKREGGREGWPREEVEQPGVAALFLLAIPFLSLLPQKVG